MIQSDTHRNMRVMLRITNIYQDGDQTTVKGVFTEEANEELANQLNSKAHFFNLGGKGVRTSDKEAMQSLYSLTLCLEADKNKITTPVF